MKDIIKNIRKWLGKEQVDKKTSDPSDISSTPGYEDIYAAMQGNDAEARRQIAADPDMLPEVLFYLSNDAQASVRRAIAGNSSTPAQASLKLATDADPDVRSSLAERISALAPNLSPDAQNRIHRIAYETLEILARDQIPRVRQILAETLKDMTDAPIKIIKGLAHDSELIVAGPILENSPILTDEDLLEIIHGCPPPGALSAISRREIVYADVADAIANSADVNAIAVLLGNKSAQIREETLDALIDRAPQYESWHQPLTLRPHLSTHAIARLTSFVADHMLKTLSMRPELDDSTKNVIAQETRRRIDAQRDAAAALPKVEREPEPPSPVIPHREQAAIDRATELHLLGALNEQSVLAALLDGDGAFVKTALRLMSGLPLEVLDRVMAAKNAKGVVAVAWKSGLSPAAAARLQTVMAKIPENGVLHPPKGKITTYPLTPQEMKQQIAILMAIASEH